MGFYDDRLCFMDDTCVADVRDGDRYPDNPASACRTLPFDRNVVDRKDSMTRNKHGAEKILAVYLRYGVD